MDHPALQANRFQPGSNVPPSRGGGLQTRGPDRRPRRLLRNMLLAALNAPGTITVEVQTAEGAVEEKKLWGRQAAAHQLLVAIQDIARQAKQNPMAVLRLLELIGEQVDGRPMPPAGDGNQRRATTFVYEDERETGPETPGSVADVVGSEPPGPDDGFERVE